MWRYRELFYVLAWARLGGVLQAVLTIVICTVIFGRIPKLSSDRTAPYPLMVFAGMLPWIFFSTLPMPQIA